MAKFRKKPVVIDAVQWTGVNHLITSTFMAGCQIQYAIQTDERPNTSSIHDYSISSGELKEFVRPTTIYIV